MRLPLSSAKSISSFPMHQKNTDGLFLSRFISISSCSMPSFDEVNQRISSSTMNPASSSASMRASDCG